MNRLGAFTFSNAPKAEDHALCGSHTIWETRAAFEVELDRRHSGRRTVGQGTTSRYLDHPQFEGFEVRQTVGEAGQRYTEL